MGSNEPKLAFEAITEADIPELTTAMTLAFDDESQRYQGIEKGGPEGYDNGDFFRKWLFSYKESQGYKIIFNEKIIGGFIVWIYENGNNVLGTIFVNPEYQNRGIGSITWEYIEKRYPETKTWILLTPSYSTRNHHFYEKKCGFTKVDEKPNKDHSWNDFIYKKSIR